MKTPSKKMKHLKFLLSYIMNYKLEFFFGLVLMIIVSSGTLVGPLILKHIIDYSVPNSDIKDMFVYAGIFVGVIVTTAVLSYIMIVMMSKLGVKIITKIKGQLFDHMLKLPVSFFDKNPVGELIAKVEGDSEKVKGLFSEFSIMVFRSFIFFVGMIIILYRQNAEVTTYFMMMIPIMFAIAVFYIRFLGKYYKKARELYSDLTAAITEYIQSISIIQIFNQKKRFEDKLDEKNMKKIKLERKTYFMEYAFWGFFVFLIETVFIVIMVLLLAPKVLTGVVTLGTLLIFIQYSQRIIEPIIMVAENLNFFQRAIVSLERIYDLFNLKIEDEYQSGDIVPDFKNEIHFKDVWFKYKEDEWVLKGVDFKIRKGEKIALVGASGSGKTTTVSLLCGFYKIQDGEILIDNQNIDYINLKKWRENIGLVLQDIFLFPGNVLENVRIYNNEIEKDEVINALKKVHLDRILNEGDKGIFEELSERGQNLSMGERQLMSFARAIVFSPEIVILDEATASVDAKTESKIQQAMHEMMQERTVITVAHRLSTVLNADRILLFEDGKIAAQGTHYELMDASEDYKKLVELQFLSEREEETVA